VTVTQGVDQVALAALFNEVHQRLNALPGVQPQDLAYAKVILEEIQKEVAQGEQADESILALKFREIAQIGPDILDVITAILASPAAGIAMVVRKIAKKACEEAGLELNL